ncbi:MAG: pantoate--beta-alanine ligase [Gammaproteobacteria bacterium]|nr:pantoate--beta-alanine ligase [Gammaproteobacteria bacterium]
MASTEPVSLMSVEGVRQWRTDRARAGKRVALVPTMGNLHAGHEALIAAARGQADTVLVSVFVNPTQFAPGEDYAGYPRTFENDLATAGSAGADAVFAPTPEVMYPFGSGNATQVDVPALSGMLCGASRPGHFRGVAGVVLRLFNLVNPDAAFFGEKDYQQLLVIRRMVRELFVPVEILGVQTVREADGLAMSSRNRYLTAAQRSQAPALYQTLERAAEALGDGAAVAEVERAGVSELEKAGFRPEYFEVRDAQTLAAPTANHDRIILAAARLGRTRLIDNVRIAG